jgi:uncharacterized protein (UPF0264 family)
MLASVNSLQEAQLVASCQVDIIDLKQPQFGALGALETALVRQIVQTLPAETQISATIGDLPMHSEVVCAAVAEMASTGVDYIKIGFFTEGDTSECLLGLSGFCQQGHALIAVLFADGPADFSLIPLLAAAGFRGVMLDTQHKKQGRLLTCLNTVELTLFVQTAKQYGLLTGLAGSLRAADIADLLPLNADYLGFRGALCREARRTAELDIVQVQSVRRLLSN